MTEREGGTLHRPSSTGIAAVASPARPVGAAVPAIGEVDAKHRRLTAQLPSGAAVSRDEIPGPCGTGVGAGVAQVDAAGKSRPGIGARHLPGRDLDVLFGPPPRHHPIDLGTAPGQRAQHPGVGPRERRHCGRDVGALHDELAARVLGSFDRGLQGVRNARNHCAESNPTLSVTRRFAPVLNRSSAASISSSCAANRCAGESVAARGGARKSRNRRKAPPRPSHSRRHCGTPSSSASALGRAAATLSRRTMARSNVLSAATWRTLTCRSPLRASLAPDPTGGPPPRG